VRVGGKPRACFLEPEHHTGVLELDLAKCHCGGIAVLMVFSTHLGGSDKMVDFLIFRDFAPHGNRSYVRIIGEC
jgi:hypothetical protein